MGSVHRRNLVNKGDVYKLHSAIWNAKSALDKAAKLIDRYLTQEANKEEDIGKEKMDKGSD